MTTAATRRGFLTSVGAWTVAGLAAPRAVAAPGNAKVLLLGTKGGPRVNKGRANPSNLVTAVGRSYVVDCGYGVTRQLVEAGIVIRHVVEHAHIGADFAVDLAAK